MAKKAFKAYGNAGSVTADTPRDAAIAYFVQFPSSRKCNVIEGESDGNFFTVRYGRTSDGEWPYSVKDVTRKTAAMLPRGRRMNSKFSVTFEKFDSYGNTSDSGELIDGTLRECMPAVANGFFSPIHAQTPEPDSWPIRGRVRWLTFHEYNSGTHEYYAEGIDETRVLHIPDSVTDASSRRIARLFRVRID